MFFSRIAVKSCFSPNKSFKFLFSHSKKQQHIKFDIYSSESFPKRFYLPAKSTILSVESLLKSEDSSIKTLEFSRSDSTPIEKTSNFLDLILKNDLKLIVNSQPFAFKVDDFNDLGYCLNSKYDELFKEKEIPLPQAAFFASLFQAYDVKYANDKKEIKAREFQEKLLDVLKNFEEINHIKVNELENHLANSMKSYENEKKQIESIEAQLNKQAQKTLKFWLALTTLQFIVLFYICYYVYGWDFTEPIGYLISLGIETAALVYFLRFRGELGQSALFNSKISKLRPKALGKISTNANAAKEFMERKISVLRRSLTFSKH